MTANQVLFISIVTLWGLLYAAVKTMNLFAGKSFSDGPSMFPLIPFGPLILHGLGAGVNLLFPPLGTIVIVLLHVGFILVFSFPPKR